MTTNIQIWDFAASVERVRPMVLRWGKLTDEILNELHQAHEVLARRRADKEHTWREYCEAIGLTKQTAHRWLTERIEVSNETSISAVMFSSTDVEWTTPEKVIARVNATLGGIDLDPCSNGNSSIATRQLTKADNGLAEEWTGKVYMNPPYGREIMKWVEKLVRSHESGDVPEAIALVPARTETAWFQQFRDYPICLLRGRLRFNGGKTGAPFPSAAVYLGERVGEFCAAFGDIGDVWIRLRE